MKNSNYLPQYLKKFFLGFLFYTLFLFTSPAFSQKAPLLVGVPQGYIPMSYVDAGGVARGISVDLWKEIAREEHLDYRFVILGSDMSQNWEKIHQHNLDVLLGPVTVDANVHLVGFSLPFFLNPISAVVPKVKVTFYKLFEGAVNNYLKMILIGYFVFFLLYLHLIWCIEYYRTLRADNVDDQKEAGVPKSYLSGIWYLFYHHISFSDHFFDVRKNNLSRIIYVIWVYCTFIFMTLLGATLTAILTTTSIQEMSAGVITETILHERPFAYMRDRPFFKSFMISRGYNGIPVSSMGEGINMIRAHKLDGVINTQLLEEQYLRDNRITDMVISTYALGYIFIYIGLPLDSPYGTAINSSIVKLQHDGVQAGICRKYDVSDFKYCSFY